VEFHEILESLGEDPDTGAIVCYVEGFRSGRAFLEAARRVAPAKPVVMYKAGRNATGARMARSHSGALAGDYAVSRDVLRQTGVTLVARPEHLLPVAEALILLPPLRGRNVAILSEGGGPITVAAEALADRGMHLVELSAATQQKIRAVIPNSTAVANPVDIAVLHAPSARSYGLCALAILEDPDVDALLFTGWFGAYGLRTGGRVAAEELEMAKRVAARARELGKAVVVQSHYATHRTEALVAMRAGGVPFHHDFDSAIECICAAVERGTALRRMGNRGGDPRVTPAASPAALLDAWRAGGRKALLETEALDLLDAFGIATPPRIFARTPAELGQAITRFGDAPLAMKIVSPDILHKSEAGGVRLGLAGAAALHEAMHGILAGARAYDARARVEGVLVSPMAAPGVEVIVGALRDPQYGPVLVFGLGGVLVEVLRDVVFRALPITAADAQEMLAQIRAHAVLDGVRGMPPSDRQALADLMLAVSALTCACPDIAELDLNPVIVHARGCTIVDARVVFAPGSPKKESPE
jgi:acetyltransferase